ncbi:hypothetical protein [Haloglomus litoreum]|uniref:hypothetical protein n=1 Tax=Haloglomus litoreum TaxID=3034026 RepID=UPI0023E7959E|nr:hypothetical protein [Haloglomus sp. DT116]
MSLAITHFAVGAALTALVLTYLVPGVRYPRLLSGLGGGWAMVPDAHWVSPVAATSLKAAHGSPLADLFWLHRALDTADPTDSKAVAAAALAGLLLVTALVERREYRAPERVQAVAEEVAATLSSQEDD